MIGVKVEIKLKKDKGSYQAFPCVFVTLIGEAIAFTGDTLSSV